MMTVLTARGAAEPAALILAGVLSLAYWADDVLGSRTSFTILAGLAFGILLQRSRFCFLCILRDFHDQRDASGLVGILTALAVGTVGYVIVFGAWLPDPSTGRLPAEAHIGPVSWPLALAGLAFGVGMALSGSCISAHLYRLGEGSVRAPFALAGTVGGFILGYLSWEWLYLRAISQAPVIWLPSYLGYGGALALQLAVLGGLFLALVRFIPTTSAEPSTWTLTRVADAVLRHRWPAWVGGVGIGLLGTATYLRTDPLGVTAQIGWLARLLGEHLGILDAGRLPGLDGFAGCATKPEEGLLTLNGWFVLALIAGSLSAALAAGQWRPTRPRLRPSLTALLGGVLMGWGAMVALGCTLGTLLSGISALALSGWVFTIALAAGAWGTFKLQK